jgi:predicted Zn finger-like uncharacterized protein
MLIVCPSCVSAYRLPPEATRLVPSAVRCAQCSAVFTPVPATSDALSSARPVEMFAPAPPDVRTESVRGPLRTVVDAEPNGKRSWGHLTVAAAIAVLGLNMAGVAFRTRIAAVAPAMAPIYDAIGLPANPPGLKLDEIATNLAEEGPGKVLTLEGKISNPGTTAAEVPSLRIVVRDETEQSIYSWTAPAPQARLGPGEVVDFRSRLIAPPAAGHDVVVSFSGQSKPSSPAKLAAAP